MRRLSSASKVKRFWHELGGEKMGAGDTVTMAIEGSDIVVADTTGVEPVGVLSEVDIVKEDEGESGYWWCNPTN